MCVNDKVGTVFDIESRFTYHLACVSNLHHKCIGKLGSTPQNTDTMWLFAVLIACSDMFRLMLLGGSRWQVILLNLIASLSFSEIFFA